MLIDTHAHLDFPEFEKDIEQVISRANASGISTIINVGSSIEGSARSLELARAYSCIYAAVGVHPHEADSQGASALEAIRKLAAGKKVVAIGEIGLDYFKNYSSAENQKKLFISLLGLAKELNLPVVLHSRQAQEDTLALISDFLPLAAVVHCFSGDSEFLGKCLDLGFLVSFTCNVTYKKSQMLRDVVKLVPLERLMLETDAPYLSPEGSRGKRNEPASIKNLCEFIAAIRNIEAQKLAQATTDNAINFLKLG